MFTHVKSWLRKQTAYGAAPLPFASVTNFLHGLYSLIISTAEGWKAEIGAGEV